MIRAIVAVLGVIALAVPAEAAFDMFLKIDGIPGESTKPGHEGWIDLLSFSIGLTQAADTVEVSPLRIAKGIDQASPKLFLYGIQEEPIPTALLEIAESGGNVIADFTLKNALVSSFRSGGSAGEMLPVEEVSFTFGQVAYGYNTYDALGDRTGRLLATWDLETGTTSLTTMGAVTSFQFITESVGPEPATIGLMALGGLGMLLRRRRRG